MRRSSFFDYLHGGEEVTRPFSNGTQSLDWQASNCDRCTKLNNCQLIDALNVAYFGDGAVPDEIARRLDYAPGRYLWQCGEVVWTEEWKAQCRATR
jgi:hypothetical protein